MPFLATKFPVLCFGCTLSYLSWVSLMNILSASVSGSFVAELQEVKSVIP